MRGLEQLLEEAHQLQSNQLTSITVESVNPHHGTYNAKSSLIQSASATYALAYKTFSSQLTIFARVYVKFSALPSSGYQLYPLRLDATGEAKRCLVWVLNDAGTLKWKLEYYAGGALQSDTTTTPAPQTDTWYCVEIKYVVSSTVGEARLYIDGVERITKTSLDTGTSGITIVKVGGAAPSLSPALNIYIDCVVVADTYIGTEAEATLVEVADSVGLSDAVLRNKALTVSDTVGLADIPLKHWIPKITDSISLTEFVEALKVAITKYVADQVSLADMARVMKNFQIANSVSLLDAAHTPTRIIKALDETLLNDMAWLNKTLTLTDQIALAEVVEKTVHGAVKTKLFLIIGDLAIQLTK